MEAARESWLNDELFAPANELPQAAARLRQMVRDYSGYHWTNHDPGRWSDVPTSQRLEQITAPTLVIVGGRDLPDFHQIADKIGRASCRERVYVLV